LVRYLLPLIARHLQVSPQAFQFLLPSLICDGDVNYPGTSQHARAHRNPEFWIVWHRGSFNETVLDEAITARALASPRCERDLPIGVR
jgi:hypothetical protein